MKTRTYSSVEAFLAHLHALKASHSPDDEKLVATMTDALAPLSTIEREAVLNDADDPATRRHRERAMLKLNRELLARKILAG
ncbi:MAG TPA: hypothetical protein VMA09_22575 [Candidatus Binataceae bacterium]|nr:hypothetical protein [Candidatus Binataceae bacterium]